MSDPLPAGTTEPQPDLPTGQLRSRLAAVLADALGRLETDRVPLPLRRLAGFAPARRAQLGGEQILRAADGDPELRERLAGQVRADLGASPDERDRAVLAWLERHDGWQVLVARATDQDRARIEDRSLREALDAAQRAERRAEAAVEELREARARVKADLEDLRTENAELRRKLGRARQEARRAVEDADSLRRTTDEARAHEAGRVAELETEVRRARQQREELEQRLNRAQRDVRSDRDEVTLRARLLLDSVVDAAQGLRRELALPAVDGAPGDRVVADLPGAGGRAVSGTGSLRTDDPALLDGLLGLPRVHLVVDGYNVTKTGWPDAALEVQRDRLVSGLSGLVARTGAEVTVVFDAAEVSGPRPTVAPTRGVRVRFTPVGVIADDVIRAFVAEEPEGRPVVVVTSDRAVVRDVVRRGGVRAVEALALVRLLARQ